MKEDDAGFATNRAFSIVLPRLAGSLTYRVASASGESRGFRLTAIAPPAVTSITARVEPPSYTRLPGAIARDPARIEAWEDSRVTLTLATSSAVRAAEVSWPRRVEVEGSSKVEPKRIEATISADGRTATALLTADAPGEYTIALRDTHGLASRPEPPRRVVVRPDEAPVVTLRETEGLDQARADDTLRVGLSASDDIAVASAEKTSFTRSSGATATVGVHRTTGRHRSHRRDDPRIGNTFGTWQEAAAGLAWRGRGRRAMCSGGYRARVVDNRPEPRGPNVAWSASRRLTVVAKADPLWAQRDRAGREAIQSKLDALKKAASENRHEAELLRYAADAVQRGNGEWDGDRRQALTRREAEARAVVDQLERLALDLAEAPAFRALARPARQIAEVEAEAARATLDQARQANDAAKRLSELRQADSRLGAVTARLEELQRGFNTLAEREADRRRLQALADRQSQVADKAGDENHPDPDRARLDQLAAEQNAVKTDLDALLKKSPELRADVMAGHAAEADELARRARALAERQREEARRATDLSKKSEVFKALADQQRALEDDARRLALDVDTPLSESQRGRINTEAIRQAVEPIERGNLEQGRQRLKDAEAELRRLARDLEDAPGDLKALARRLSQRQERIAHDLGQALGESRNKPELPADQRATTRKALEPLVDREKEIAALARAVLDAKDSTEYTKDGEARFPREAAEKAVSATTRAVEAISELNNPRETASKANEAREALNRLAEQLPDASRREAPVRRALADLKRAADEAVRESERHLQEAERARPKEAARAAEELARKLEPVVKKARQTAEKLAALEPGRRSEPQRDRGSRRLRAFADAVEAARSPAGSPAQIRAQRDAVAAAAIGARAALDRFEQKLHGQLPADDLAEELAAEQHALAPDPAEQHRLATALRALQVPDASMEQAEAVRLTERAAHEGKSDDIARASEAVEALADRLTDRQSPRNRAKTLARAERGLNDPADPPDPANEILRQRAIAAELTRLPKAANGDDKAAETIRAAAALAERAQRAEEPSPDQNKPIAAQQAEARARAAEALDALAARLPADPAMEPAPSRPPSTAALDPELAIDPNHVAQAQALARRERQVRERLQALLGEQVKPQQDLRRESLALGRELGELRDRAKAVSDQGHGQANEAAANLGQHAPRAMDDAASQLAQGQPAQARDAQRRAAELAERGAQNAEDLAAALRADRAAAPSQANAAAAADPDAKHQPDANSLAAAREAMSQAARQLGQARAPQPDAAALNAARQAMRGAADRLQAAAEANGQGQPGNEPGQQAAQGPASGAPTTGEPQGGPAGVADAESLAELQEMIRNKTGRRWGELPGHLRSEILQMSQGRYRNDYARLIQLYFREIAAGAEANPCAARGLKLS